MNTTEESFLEKRLPFFGNRAMLVLCIVFFVLPFALRGARMAVESMKNDVADWLPGDYVETQHLSKFRDYFVGDQFVVITWPGCSEEDSNFQRLIQKLEEESVAGQELMDLSETEIRAHETGDRLGLHTTGNYHEEWGAHRERWLMGHNGQWYYITQRGELFEWDGKNNIFDAMKRGFARFFHGSIQATGRYQDKFGDPPSAENGYAPNPFYENPERLHARFFKRIVTGPDVFELLAGDEGILKTGDYTDSDEQTFNTKMEAHRRLEGWLFGPTPKPGFDWTWDSLIAQLSEAKREQLVGDEKRKQEFESFVTQIVADRYGGDIELLLKDTHNNQRELWFLLWKQLMLEPPARQTCILVYLNEPVLDELARAVGRPLMGKPRGRLLELASGECGIAPERLRIGGPPVDNVAIDEEGSITLLKLVSLSAVIGIGLAYLSFRSIKITMMLFFCGGVAAISSLALVHYAGSTLDAILMSMPSLIYVLGLSGAVHIVNYYKEACHEFGERGAAEKAIRMGWFPCTLAAFTTALGLISLYTSTLTPIYKFGKFSAIATMATVLFLITYLPAALHMWRPGYKKKTAEERGKESAIANLVAAFWRKVCDFVVARHAVVTTLGVVLLIVFGLGISRIETSVQLLKLFDKDAKILGDYAWIEENLGHLVPMEILLTVPPNLQKDEAYVADAAEESAGGEQADKRQNDGVLNPDENAPLIVEGDEPEAAELLAADYSLTFP